MLFPMIVQGVLSTHVPLGCFYYSELVCPQICQEVIML